MVAAVGSPKSVATPKVVPTTPYGGASSPSTPAPPTPASPPSPVTMSPSQWAGQVAGDLGITGSNQAQAVQDILSWMPYEEPTSQWWGGFGTASDPTRINPVNTGLQAYGYGPTPATGNETDSGLGTYPTLTAAAQAAASTLQESPYSAALAALQSGGTPSAFQQAMSASPWAGGHYAGDTFSPSTAAQEAGGPAVTGGAVGAGGGNALPPAVQDSINSLVSQYASQAGLNPQQSSQLQQILESQLGSQMYQGLLGQNSSSNQLAYAGQEYANTTAQAQQQYGFEQQQQAIQQGQLQTQGTALNQQGTLLNTQQLGAQHQYNETLQSLQSALQNLTANYGFQQQQLGQQRQESDSGMAASGTFNTGSRARANTQFDLTAAEEAQQFQYGSLANAIQQSQAGIAYNQTKAGETYQQQQVTNAQANLQSQFAQLGLSQEEAQAGLANALTNAGLQNVMTTDQLSTQLALQQANMPNSIGTIMSTLISASPMISALVGGS